MKSVLVLSVFLALTFAKETRKEIEKGKRDTSEDYLNDRDYQSHSSHQSPGPLGDHGGRAVSFSEVIQRIPTRSFTPSIPNSNHFNQPHHIPFGRVSSLPVKLPIAPYPVALVKRVPYIAAIDRPIPLSFQPSYQNFVITKVPLVYQASYGDQHDFGHFSPSAPPVAVGRNYAEEHY
ncbi:hypothetical protein O3M35_000990 [Rhynocoris fuscipes]|uniref:Uncharacterized protein n=1 Tax=Rhynocoris fuscipes TaxID=488301 RepID=A0AAW1DNP6_9HEMI